MPQPYVATNPELVPATGQSRGTRNQPHLQADSTFSNSTGVTVPMRYLGCVSVATPL